MCHHVLAVTNISLSKPVLCFVFRLINFNRKERLKTEGLFIATVNQQELIGFADISTLQNEP